jgi:hypothetical protein
MEQAMRENLMPLNIEKDYILENRTSQTNYDFH